MIDRLRVNPIYKTLEVSGGNVQTRVNGIEVKGNEIASILAKDIKRIEFIENPGSRYHDTELGAVINIITKKREDGGQVSANVKLPHVFWVIILHGKVYLKFRLEFRFNNGIRNKRKGEGM